MKMDIHCRIRATDIQGGTNVTQLYSDIYKFNQDIRFCFVLFCIFNN